MVEKAMLSRESHHWKKAIQAIIEENCYGRFTGGLERRKKRMLTVVKSRQEDDRLYSGRTPGQRTTRPTEFLLFLSSCCYCMSSESMALDTTRFMELDCLFWLFYVFTDPSYTMKPLFFRAIS